MEAKPIYIAVIGLTSFHLSTVTAASTRQEMVRAETEIVNGRTCRVKRVHATHPEKQKAIQAWEQRVARRWGGEWASWNLALRTRTSRYVTGGGGGSRGGGGGPPLRRYWEASARPCSSRH
jgi:hypothetical protein